MVHDDENDEKTILRPPQGFRRPKPNSDQTTILKSPLTAPDREVRPPKVRPLASFTDFESIGQNPLLSAAATVLVLGSRLAGSAVQGELSALRRRAESEIERFKSRCAAANVASATIESASYLLCTYFDTAVMRTPWGSKGEWGQHSLLVAFHGEAFGGENFFQIGERALKDPERSIDLLELVYVCLMLGFEGRFRGIPNGREQLEDFKRRLYREIEGRRGEVSRELSERWKGVDAELRPGRTIPAWGAALAAVLIVFLLWAALRQSLSGQLAPIMTVLSSPVVIPAEDGPIVRSARLRPLLAAQEEAGLISVEEDSGGTTIILNSTSLFSAGSAEVSPDVGPTLSAIADAFDEVPGRVLVVGHTDDVPIRSFRFADNFALSRARAESVRQALVEEMKSGGQVDIRGAGASQPRFLPAEAPENRARNRRVELIHSARGDGNG